MSLNYNKVILGGNLTRDPEIRFLNNDKAVGSFGLAVNHKYKTAQGEAKEETTFVDVECWGRTAENVGQYLAKGRSCLVEGRLKLETWDDKATGQKRSKLKVVAETVQFVGGEKREGGYSQGSNQASGPSVPVGSSVPADDEPPF